MSVIIYSSRVRKPLKPSGLRTKKQRLMVQQTIALEKQADAILKAITGNQCLPTRQELKRMVNAGKWSEIGNLFSFAPVFMKTFGGKECIDWRCVPKRVYELLQIYDASRHFQQKTSPRLLEAAPRKKLAPKNPDSVGRREKSYCEQSASCHYCGQYTVFNCWTLDHKTPVCRGGGNTIENLIGCCSNCNKSKSCLNYEEFMATDFMGGANSLKDEIKRVSDLVRGTV